MSNMPDDPWPLRPWLLGGLGLLYCTWFHWLGEPPLSTLEPRLIALLAIAPGIALFAFAFTVERARWRWSLGFALGLGLLMALLSYWVIGAQPNMSELSDIDDISPRFTTSALLFTLLAIPYFQALQDEPKLHHRLWQLPYSRLHDHAWTNVVLVPAAFVFTGLVGLLLILWGQLFKLIGVSFFVDLFEKSWFLWPVLTAAWLTGLALLRDWPRVVLPLRRMMLVILSALAPALATIALLWMIFLPFTGLAPLWATRSATPILLLVMAFALLLANAVIRDDAQDEPKSILLRASGRVLGGVLLPLGVIAAISLALRINQYGWTPERCYAALFIAIALLYAINYTGLLVVRWSHWSAAIRPMNIRLGLGVMMLALLVSTPLMDVERVSVKSQMARLYSGRTKVADFDFAALKFKMGNAGLAALAELRALPSSHPQAAAIRQEVANIDKATSYWDTQYKWRSQQPNQYTIDTAQVFDKFVHIYPKNMILPEGLKAAVLNNNGLIGCTASNKQPNGPHCALILADIIPGGPPEAITLLSGCMSCNPTATLWLKQDKIWARAPYSYDLRELPSNKVLEALNAGRFSVVAPNFKILQIDGQSIVIDPNN